MVSEDTSTHENGPVVASSKEAATALAKRRRGPVTSTLTLTAAISLAVGAGLGYAIAHSSWPTSGAASGGGPIIAGVSKKTVCKLVSGAMQQQLSIREASLMVEEKGGASCYLMMTEDGAADPAGFVVAFYPTTASLQQTVDGTDVIPEKAEPLLIEGRAAARQVLYGDAWKAQLTVDVGDGATLYVERFGPKGSLSERELRRSVDDLAASVLKGQTA
ncbi:hypothetical protein ACWDU8_05745 [Streptomyces sp. NPDC003388]|uniref:hypothetical protein n=1 Tax=Streptomyces sp. ATE26 TaxID=2954237 RepID=UPI0024831D5C|nr:hypothetical protein [Streptomyces sp. ATE26]MDI1456472.1 hypothetical protein [Streptomyces sp. ATE26]